jgi:hypothetical protein
MIISRVALEPVSQGRKIGIFNKLLKLDQTIVSGNTPFTLKKLDKVQFLVVIRRSLIRFSNIVSKFVIEVIFFFKFHLTCRIMD